eukprot:g19262.t1
MWHDEKVWPHLAPEERQKVRGYAAQYKRITGEEALDPNQPAVRSALSRSDLRPWLKMSGYADTGREAPYFLQPDTGEVIHLPEADEQSVQTDAFGYAEQRDIRSMSILEEDLEALETGAERHQGLRSQRAKKRKETARSARLGPQEVIEYMVGDEDESSGAEEDPNVQKEIRKKRQGMDSYCPGGKRAHRPEHNKLHGEPDEENLGGRQGELGRNVPSEPVAFTVQDVLVGYGDLKPGVVPWQIFKRGTIFLAISWAPGTRDGPKTSASGSGREMGVNGGELDEEVKSEERTKQQREYLEKLPWLPGGEKVKTHWPIHSGFQPRALSCDPLGQNIVVADDFKIYAAKLRQRTVEQMDESSRLRGGGATTERHNLEANFEPQPRRCQCGMHGQQLKALQSAGLARAWDDAVGV